jgi:UDP-N-acetylglucosamine 2-epimerase
LNHILTIIGTRPNIVKAAVVSEALKKQEINETILYTGQHYDHNMSKMLLEQLGVRVTFAEEAEFENLRNPLMMARPLQRLLHMVSKIDLYLYGQRKPDYVLVYGDTDSSLAGAIAAAKNNIPIIHVEAGLRSHNMIMQEEKNRIVIDHLSELLFAPTMSAYDNLQKEGIKDSYFVGDVMYDAVLKFDAIAEKQQCVGNIVDLHEDYYLVTIHRAELVDNKHRLETVLKALETLAIAGKKIVFPVHPRTATKIEEFNLIDLWERLNKKVAILPPQSYFDSITLEKNAKMVLTDSGGVQKEAFFYKVPCVVLRQETEYTELCDSGWCSLLTDFSQESILWSIENPSKVSNCREFGDGHAADKIAEIIKGAL